jgi:hypothetical protein
MRSPLKNWVMILDEMKKNSHEVDSRAAGKNKDPLLFEKRGPRKLNFMPQPFPLAESVLKITRYS